MGGKMALDVRLLVSFCPLKRGRPYWPINPSNGPFPLTTNYRSGSFDSRVAISPRRSCASGSAAVCKLRFLPEHGVSDEHALVLQPDGHPTQKASDPDSILEPPLLATR